MWGRQQQCHGTRRYPLPGLYPQAHTRADRGRGSVADTQVPDEETVFVGSAMAGCVVERPRLNVSPTVFAGAHVCDALCCHLHQARDLSTGKRVQSDGRRAAAHDLVGHSTHRQRERGRVRRGRPGVTLDRWRRGACPTSRIGCYIRRGRRCCITRWLYRLCCCRGQAISDHWPNGKLPIKVTRPPGLSPIACWARFGVIARKGYGQDLAGRRGYE